MDRITLRSRVGTDGVLKLAVPLGLADANREVRVTVEPTSPAPAAMTQDEWRRFIAETAGRWQGKLERPQQSEFERRHELS